MKKRSIFVILVALGLSAAACSPATPVTPVKTIPPTATFIRATPDISMSTPTVGFGTVLALQGLQGVLLHSRPDGNSDASGDVLPGDAVRVLGVDATNSWLLVESKNQTGWISIKLVAFNISQ